MMKCCVFLAFFLFTFTGISQTTIKSIHEVQLEQYNATNLTDAADYESQPTELISFPKVSCDLDKIVYGWHPYWGGSAYQNYQWDLLSHMSFFSYEVNSADGQPNSTHGWATSAAVDAALASGNTKVTLCVTLFSGHATFFASPSAQQTLINNLISLVSTRGAHGVNIDFEGIPSSQTTNFANFMVSLSNQMHSAIPGSEVSTVLYAVDWNNVFDFSIMEPVVDHYIIMGYGYYYSGSSNAGPTDPLYHYGTNYNYTLSRSITYYLDKGCPKNKLVLGLPNYGYEWPTSSLGIPAATAGSGTSRTYSYVKNNTSGNYSTANHVWEGDSYTNVFSFNDGGNKQCQISMDSSWQKRLEHARRTGIAGIGIWALGYDNGYTQLWQAMSDYLTNCYEDPCSDQIHDFGGPTKNYYNNEDYTWTIAPEATSSIDIDFTMFDVESNFDYLYIYDGIDTGATQIAGSPFTGLNSPGSFTTSTGAVTFRFTSDGATVAPGFLANYSCNSIPVPTASFSAPNTTICLGDSILLNSNSLYANSYSWSTSGGGLSNSTSENPYLFPSSSGNYAISLVVTNGSGTDSTGQVLQVIVESSPVAMHGVNSMNLVIPNAFAYFSNNSVNGTSYYWNFGDGNSSTDNQPWHEYTANGTYNGYLVAMNSGCLNDTSFFTINVGTQSLNENEYADISVYPNPFTNKFHLTNASEIEKIVVHDVRGRSVSFDSNTDGNILNIELNNAAQGMYTLIVYKNDQPAYFKLLKQ
jgi:spore germination protein YaaH/PKD repeat protein